MVAGKILAQMVLSGEESFISGINSAGDEMSDSSRSAGRLADAFSDLGSEATSSVPGLHRLAGALDRVGNQAGETRRKVRRTSGAFGSLSVGTEGVRANFGGVVRGGRSVVAILGGILAAAVPLVATIGTLAAGFAAVAGVFGLIIGSGILAFGKKKAKQNKKQLKQVNKRIKKLEKHKKKTGSLTKAQRKQLKTLKKQQKKLEDATTAGGALARVFGKMKKEIVPLIVELGEKFIPLIEDAINALPGLVKSIIRNIGPLDKFRDALRTLGSLAVKVIPKLVKLFFDLAEFTLPIFTSLAKILLNNLVPALKSIFATGKRVIRTLGKVVPPMKSMKGAANNLSKFINKLKDTFLDAIGQGRVLDKNLRQLSRAAVKFWNKLKPVLKTLKPLIKQLVRFVEIVVKAGIEVATLALNIGSKLLPLLKPIIKGVTTIITKFNNFASKAVKLGSSVRLSGKRMAKMGQSMNRLKRTVTRVFNFIKKIVTGVMNFLTDTVFPSALSRATKLWNRHGAEIMDSVRQLTDFLSWILYKTMDAIKFAWNLFGDELMTVIRAATDAILSIVGAFTDTLLTGFDVLTDILAGNWKEGFKKLKDFAGRLLGGILDFVGKWAGKLVDAMLSAGKDAANALIDAFNRMLPDSIPIPEVTIGVGVPGPDYTFGGGSLDIPHLAKGGIVTGPTLAVIGEKGPEAVVPLSGSTGTVGTANNSQDIARAIREELRNLRFALSINTDDEALAAWMEQSAEVVIQSAILSSFEQFKRRNETQGGNL